MVRMITLAITIAMSATGTSAQTAKFASRFDFQEGTKPCTSYGLVLPKADAWVYNLGGSNPNVEVGSSTLRTFKVPGGKIGLAGYSSWYYQKGQIYAVPSVVWSLRTGKWQSCGNIGGYAPITDDRWFVFLKEANLTRQCGEFRFGVAATFIAKQDTAVPILWGGKLEWHNLQLRALLPHGREPARVRLFALTNF